MGRHGLHAAPRSAGKRAAVRSGLLGVSVAVALGTAAVITTGVVPVGSAFPYVGTETKTEGKTEAGAKATPEQDGVGRQQSGLANLSGRASTGPGAGTGSRSAPSSHSAAPSKPVSPSPSPSAPAPASEAPAASATAKPAPATPTEAPAKPAAPKPALPKPVQPKPVQPKPVLPKPVPPKPVPPKPTPAQPTPTPTPTPAPSTATPATGDGHSAEEAAVVTLVNQERAQAGCGPVRANPPLATLASAFSKDMAVRGFFDHTDPDGNTPWARAQNAGIGGLGGENIARGQGDAEAVMKAWMNSPGHKANILNCEFRTLGVGAYFADGGPWWTQDFGF
ncbi:CAP domain-containing protein [Streptomyces goshikiensis]|uniref:CAP domain-containing protein n=1 Tax=Streptomyces goshikiensis TaxID=1942 RepID=UPI00378C47D0